MPDANFVRVVLERAGVRTDNITDDQLVRLALAFRPRTAWARILGDDDNAGDTR